MPPWKDDPAAVRPMLASTGEAPLDSADLAYEPKYDGIRAIVSVEPGAGARFWSRLGNEKTTQFPDVATALREWARQLDRPVLVDGEIVALDERGEPAGFQQLQGRIHLKSAERPDAAVALILFDILRHGPEDLRPLPLRERRARLETLFGGRRPGPAGAGVLGSSIRISEQAAGDGRPLYGRAQAHGWEGLIAKRLDSIYRSGKRTTDWRKLKLVRRQACVVGGWTDPRGSRPFFGALLLGVHDEPAAPRRGAEDSSLRYVGHTGAGFSDAELGRVWRRLHALQSKSCPFSRIPRTNERPHWTRPVLVAEVKFTEWTNDGKLRHPTYIGLRDDIAPDRVRKEPDTIVASRPLPSAASGTDPNVASAFSRKTASSRKTTSGRKTASSRKAASSRKTASSGKTFSGRTMPASRKTALSTAVRRTLLDRLDAIEQGGGSGVLELPGGDRLDVTNLGKPFWKSSKLTKGDLFRHYVRVAALILPAIVDRPLVMKRYPAGVGGKPFYQHRAPDTLPPGVRVEAVDAGTERRPHLIGGSLVTLLYTAQLASISQDPWFSRVGSPGVIDHVALDLDPPDDLPFARVLDVARWLREALEALKAPAFAKTSGAGGLHVYVPMPPDTPYEAGLLFAQIVATMVAGRHPKLATVERSLAARGRRIYVDYLQNIRGKTLASAYSVRANDFAGVSTPVTWDEIDEGVSPKDFTLRTFGDRVEAVGDLWAGLRKSRGADISDLGGKVEKWKSGNRTR